MADKQHEPETPQEAAERAKLIDQLLEKDFTYDKEELERERLKMQRSTNAIVDETLKTFGRYAIIGGSVIGGAVGFLGALSFAARRNKVPFTGRTNLPSLFPSEH